MSEKIFRGKVIIVHNKTQKVTIEYVSGNKTKTIAAIVDDIHQERWIEKKLIKKAHRFLSGDHVRFAIHKSGAGVYYADQVVFEYNHAMEVLVNKAKVENRFAGYVKLADEQYFIKEIDSYLFIPLVLSRFEIPPVPSETGKPVVFKLLHIDKPDRIIAELYNHNYVPGYKVAIKQFKNEETINATVKKITPFGVFVILAESQLESKLPIDDNLSEKINKGEIDLEKSIEVKIKHLSGDRIVIEAAS